jgi:predicted restriction endonuclease
MQGIKLCIICNAKEAERAHVKPKRDFDKNQNDQYHNIIDLCHEHHYDYFDEGKIGICPNKQKLIIEKNGQLEILNLSRGLNIKSKYIQEKNELCSDRIRYALGLTPNSSGKLCNAEHI